MKQIKMMLACVTVLCVLSLGTAHATTLKTLVQTVHTEKIVLKTKSAPTNQGEGFFFWWAKNNR